VLTDRVSINGTTRTGSSNWVKKELTTSCDTKINSFDIEAIGLMVWGLPPAKLRLSCQWPSVDNLLILQHATIV